MHDAALAFIRHEAARLPREVRVFEIGSRNINGSARSAFPRALAYHGIDLAPGPDVDAVANALDYDPPFVPDVIICCEVLEHTPDAERLIHRACELLAQGGTFLATMAGPRRTPHSAHDGGVLRPGEFYRNCDPALVRQWCEAFDDHILGESLDGADVFVVCTQFAPDVKGTPMPENPDSYVKFGEVICLALALEKRLVGLDAAQIVYALSLIQATYIVAAAAVNGQDPKALTEVVADQVRRCVNWLGTDLGELHQQFTAAMQSRPH